MVVEGRKVYLKRARDRLLGTLVFTCVIILFASFHLTKQGQHMYLSLNQRLPGHRNATPGYRVSGVFRPFVNATEATSTALAKLNATMETRLSCRPLKWIANPKVNGVTVYPPDFMSLKPFEFLKNFKNPCFRRDDARVSCFPYYFLVGAPKSGTTDLSKRIGSHPQVSTSVAKEPHWITRGRYRFMSARKSYPTIYTYLDKCFARATLDIIGRNKSSFHNKVVGDCSASTLWDNSFWPLLRENENRSEPLHTTADFIHHISPRTKILIILRNPTDRAYSDYKFFPSKHNKSLEDFHLHVEQSIKFYVDCFRRCSHIHCLNEPMQAVRVNIGVYYYPLADYMKVFPRDQIMVMKMEDYAVNVTKHLRSVFAFLELEPLKESKLAAIANDNEIYNANVEGTRRFGPMLPKTRALLENFYRPFNEKLEHLLGTTLWEDVS